MIDAKGYCLLYGGKKDVQFIWFGTLKLYSIKETCLEKKKRVRIETHPLCGKYLLFQPVRQIVLFFYHAQRLALIVRDNAQQISSYF